MNPAAPVTRIFMPSGLDGRDEWSAGAHDADPAEDSRWLPRVGPRAKRDAARLYQTGPGRKEPGCPRGDGTRPSAAVTTQAPRLTAVIERARIVRILILAATGFFVVAAIAEFAWLWGYIDSQDAIGADFVYFRSVAEHWLQTGELYGQRQLAGPYEVETLVDVLYPPNALLLFVPFVWLPWPLWWLIPVTVFAWSLRRLRPAAWTWPFIAAGLAYPPTISQFIYGNTNTWVAAAVAAGFVLCWPGVMVLLKPSFLPFALVGVTSRRWWVALAVLAAASVPFGGLWIDYATAMRNSSLTWGHALIGVPLMLVPVIAWLGRDRARRPPAWSPVPRRHVARVRPGPAARPADPPVGD